LSVDRLASVLKREEIEADGGRVVLFGLTVAAVVVRGVFGRERECTSSDDG